MFNVRKDINNSRKKKINFRVELQSRELNLALRKTTVQISKFFFGGGGGGEGDTPRNVKYSFTANVSIDGDYNNLRKLKSTLL